MTSVQHQLRQQDAGDPCMHAEIISLHYLEGMVLKACAVLTKLLTALCRLATKIQSAAKASLLSRLAARKVVRCNKTLPSTCRHCLLVG